MNKKINATVYRQDKGISEIPIPPEAVNRFIQAPVMPFPNGIPQQQPQQPQQPQLQPQQPRQYQI